MDLQTAKHLLDGGFDIGPADEFGELVRHLVAELGPFADGPKLSTPLSAMRCKLPNFFFDTLALYTEPTRKRRPSPKGPIVRSTSTAMRVRQCREWPPL